MLIRMIERDHENTISGIDFSGVEMSLHEVVKHIYDNGIRCYNMNNFISDFIKSYDGDIMIYSFIENKVNIISQTMLTLNFNSKYMDIYNPNSYPNHVVIPIDNQKNIISKLQKFYQESN